MKVTIDVMQDDIDNGEPGEGCACPVYLAIARAVPAADHFAVGVEHVHFYDSAEHDNCVGAADLPGVAQGFIGRFDNAHSVEPFSFELDVPDALVVGS